MAFNDLRFRLLLKFGPLICPDYRFKWMQMDWLHDRKFNDYLARFGELGGLNTERRWMLKELMRLIEGVPGDTAECGVFEGAGSYLMCEMNAASRQFERHHHIFDSFAGLSAPKTEDGAYWTKGDLSRGESIVRTNLAQFSNVSFYEGWIPERFPEVADKRFSFAHIDVDLYQPTLDSLGFFYDRMNDGGIIVCDDYGSSFCPGATRAVDTFLSDKSEHMIALPSCGGFLIKGIATSAKGGIQQV